MLTPPMDKITARNILGFVVVFGFIAITVYEVALKGSMREMLLGAWLGAFTTIVGFHFGTSHGSEMKTQLMAGKGRE